MAEHKRRKTGTSSLNFFLRLDVRNDDLFLMLHLCLRPRIYRIMPRIIVSIGVFLKVGVANS